MGIFGYFADTRFMPKKALTLLIFLSFFVPSLVYSRTLLKIRPICGNYQIESRKPFKFNNNEQKLICGDPKVPAWNVIPETQAKYSIKNFLQVRGYYYPKFVKEGEIITVYPGEVTKIKEIIIEGDHPASLHMNRKRKVKRKPLTPSLLTNIQHWITSELNNTGYPCAKVNIGAEAYSGKVIATINSGCFQNFQPVTEPKLEAFNPEALRRFDAFKVGKPFNQQMLTLTSRRIESNGIVQNTYFTSICKNDKVDVAQITSLGKPHLFSFGVGFNTEEYAKGKVSWKQTRLDTRGSSAKISGIASYRRQKFQANIDWFLLKKPSRWHLFPEVSFERRFERKYEFIRGAGRVYPRTSWDGQHLRLDFGFGPEFSYYKTYKGANRNWTRFVSGNVGLSVASHDYEFYDYNPRNGFSLAITGTFNSKAALSDVSAQKILAYGEWLWNIGDFDPSLFVLGIRGKIGTTITNRNSPNFGNLPPEYLLYLGGSSDLRGFKRQELPVTYSGALTLAFISAELRLANALPLGIQPIAFTDFGALGVKSANFDYPAYWSPGVGMRLYSLIGVFRFTAAHGFLIKNNNPGNSNTSHWQFFFSYGEEF